MGLETLQLRLLHRDPKEVRQGLILLRPGNEGEPEGSLNFYFQPFNIWVATRITVFLKGPLFGPLLPSFLLLQQAWAVFQPLSQFRIKRYL